MLYEDHPVLFVLSVVTVYGSLRLAEEVAKHSYRSLRDWKLNFRWF